MGEEQLLPSGEDPSAVTAEQWLLRARRLVPTALRRAREAKGYPSRWKVVVAKLEQVPTCLSSLSGHPCFARNALCREQLQCVCGTLLEASELAVSCGDDDAVRQRGKLQTQSDLDAVIGKLEQNLRDCRLLVKTGVLGDTATPAPGGGSGVRELLARLQIGDVDAKHRAVDGLLELMSEDERSVLGVLGRSDVAALVRLLGATSGKVREKAAAVVCRLAGTGSFENSLVCGGALPPLIRLSESGSAAAREKALAALQRLSVSPETARAIAGHGGIRQLVEACMSGDSVASAAAGALKNLSVIPELRQDLAEEGAIKAAIELLDCATAPAGSRECAAQCLQNMTASNESLRRAVAAEGGVRSLLAFIEGGSAVPQEPAVGALKNLVCSVPLEGLLLSGLLPRMVHVMTTGSPGAKQAAASTVWKISSSNSGSSSEIKRLVGESGCIPPLVRMLESKSSGSREAAAQALSSLVGNLQNAREVKDGKSVPSLVQLLDPSPLNGANKYAITCMLAVSSSKRCRKFMVFHGAIGYLKKLGEMDMSGALKLLERLDQGRLRRMFSRK